MLSVWALSALALAYLAGLFAIAHVGDRLGLYPRVSALRPWVYGLALGVYCTSWTFFGAVGTAVRDGWSYLPIYLGPALLFLLAVPFLRRLATVGRAQRVASIADFVAARYGKSRALAVLVTLIAFVAAIPYIALQYKAVATAIALLADQPAARHWWNDTALPVALLMAVFAVLYGARRVDATVHRQGLMLAIAFESLFKLVAFVSVGVFAAGRLPAGAPLLPAQLAGAGSLVRVDALATTLLAAAAIFCLPRQFHVGVVECAEPADLGSARWVLPAYLALFCLCVVPVVGLHASGGAPGGPADALMLTLPLAYGARGLAALSFLGGLSAATAMVVVASIALATMIANDIAAPLVWRRRLEAGEDLGRRLLWVRRLVILGLALLSFAYYRVAPGSASLASIGLLAFAAVAQFAPAVCAALYWTGTNRSGVFWGLLAGFAAWVLLLLVPALSGSRFPLASAASCGVLALAVNVAIVLVATLVRPATLQERLTARDFVAARDPAADAVLPPIRASVADVQAVAARIVGHELARQALADYQRREGKGAPRPADTADRAILLHFERTLAASIGASSARVVLTHALRRKGLSADQVAALLDETSQELRFSRQVLQATMDNVTQGISVVNAQLDLVAWNRRYLEMFAYPEGLASVGRPVAELIRFNAQRGEFGPGDPEQQVAKRLAHLRAGTAYEYQRTRPDGRVLNIQGQPIPGGGFVTTYSDVTEFKRAEAALLEAKQGLEARVEQRTRELSAAKQVAEEANASKTRFVAAATHDLLQPLNAARLFSSALAARCHGEERLAEAGALTARIDDSLRVAEEMLGDLLDVARLDAGALRPEIAPVPLADLLDDLRRQYAPVARGRHLRLHVVRTRATVLSDRTMLRRILQNYLANALRYTRSGGVTLGCRRRGAELEVLVLDTGPGIASELRSRLYEAFNRLGTGSPWGERGTGLGLSICDRFAALLGHRLTLASRVGHGSAFGVRLALAAADAAAQAAPRPAAAHDPGDLAELRVLCVDNDGDILAGMEALLGEWGVRVDKALDAAGALASAARNGPDALLVDYHLGNGMDGLQLAREARRHRPGLPVSLVTADRSAPLAAAARAEGIPVLHKPVRPAALRAVLGAARRARPGG